MINIPPTFSIDINITEAHLSKVLTQKEKKKLNWSYTCQKYEKLDIQRFKSHVVKLSAFFPMNGAKKIY